LSYKPREEAIKRSLELRKMFGAPVNDKCEVEFFFYANKMDNALDLMNKLKEMNYIVECVQSDNTDGKFLITGNTPTIDMQSNEMIIWSNQMHDLAVEFNCEFDEWDAQIENKEPVGKKSETTYL
jgi:hypothetical protein